MAASPADYDPSDSEPERIYRRRSKPTRTGGPLRAWSGIQPVKGQGLSPRLPSALDRL